MNIISTKPILNGLAYKNGLSFYSFKSTSPGDRTGNNYQKPLFGSENENKNSCDTPTDWKIVDKHVKLPNDWSIKPDKNKKSFIVKNQDQIIGGVLTVLALSFSFWVVNSIVVSTKARNKLMTEESNRRIEQRVQQTKDYYAALDSFYKNYQSNKVVFKDIKPKNVEELYQPAKSLTIGTMQIGDNVYAIDIGYSANGNPVSLKIKSNSTDEMLEVTMAKQSDPDRRPYVDTALKTVNYMDEKGKTVSNKDILYNNSVFDVEDFVFLIVQDFEKAEKEQSEK